MKIVTPVFLGLATFTASCTDLATVGRAPGMSPIGSPLQTSAGPLAPSRAAIAVPPPRQIRKNYSRPSLWNSGPASLFGDRRARNLGDIMTVVIEIKDEASINNSTSRSRSGSENMSIPSLIGIPQVINKRLPDGADLANAANTNSTSSASGDGSVTRNEEITLRVAATVVDVLPNGHLVVQGNQEVRVNFELRDLQIAGIVRPHDISRRNEITYDKIAGARISYGGRGQISQMQQPRYGQQIADILLPF